MLTLDLFVARCSNVANSRVVSRRVDVRGSTVFRRSEAIVPRGRAASSCRVRVEKALLEM